MPEMFKLEKTGCVLSKRDEVTASAANAVDAVNKFTLRTLAASDFSTFRLDLCNNEIDSYYSRFPEDELQTIDQLVVGRPLMERHDTRGSLPRGTYFRSFVFEQGNRQSVRPDVYILNTKQNEEFIQHIEGGVYRDTSIGFSFKTAECSICGNDIRSSECKHWPGQEYDGHVCHYIMRDVVKVHEGSVVASGAQGTQFVASGVRSFASPLDTIREAKGGQKTIVEFNSKEKVMEKQKGDNTQEEKSEVRSTALLDADKEKARIDTIRAMIPPNCSDEFRDWVENNCVNAEETVPVSAARTMIRQEYAKQRAPHGDGNPGTVPKRDDHRTEETPEDDKKKVSNVRADDFGAAFGLAPVATK